jgi:disulfide oxidoreductase YuzD
VPLILAICVDLPLSISARSYLRNNAQSSLFSSKLIRAILALTISYLSSKEKYDSSHSVLERKTSQHTLEVVYII